MSIVWRGIVENSKDAHVYKRVGTEAFCWQVGNGRTTTFWVDIWCSNYLPKLEFPRLFRLARQKGGTMVEYSRNNRFSRVKWNELFTRSLLEREEEMLRRLEDRVSSTELVLRVEDRLCWVHDSNREFTVSKCSELLIIDGEDDINFAFDKIWKLKVPPRVRSFLWMLAIDRIHTKEFLIKRGVKIQNILIGCPWCERVPEGANHLFFKCKFIEGFWYKIFNWWEAEWESVEGFDEFYTLCYNMKLVGIRKSLWLISISTACWTVWLVRNGLVFERKMMTMETLIFQSKMRALLWIRSVYDGLLMQESSWRICSNRCGIDTIKSRSSSSIWCPPSEGCLKFNVCGIANDDSAGCGGVLRDMEGVARALFSGLIATNDADSAEVGALLLALEVFISLEWKINDSLFVEIGSNVIFNWCANKLMRPWSLQSTFADIERKIEKVGSVVFSLLHPNRV